MNQEEVIAFFQLSDLSELPDVLEQELFELKKDILTKPLLFKPLQTKKKRLLLLKTIAETYLVTEKTDSPIGSFLFEKSTKPLGLWKAYMQDKNEWKRLFSVAISPAYLLDLLSKGLEIELHYTQQFPAIDWIEEQPVFGVEPDPMPIQKGLLFAAEQGWDSFELLESHKSELDKALLLGLKRLSLQIKFLKE